MTKTEIFASMAQNIGDDQDLLNEIFQDYLATAETILNSAVLMLANSDFESLRKSAHTLKGCSANVGAEDLRAAAYAWEIAAKTSDAELCKKQHSEITHLLAELK